jgi:hypothetical protein
MAVKMVADLYQQYQMDGTPKPCVTVPLIFKCSLNSQTPNELSYTDDKFPFKDRGPLKLAAVYLPFIYFFLKLRDKIS